VPLPISTIYPKLYPEDRYSSPQSSTCLFLNPERRKKEAGSQDRKKRDPKEDVLKTAAAQRQCLNPGRRNNSPQTTSVFCQPLSAPLDSYDNLETFCLERLLQTPSLCPLFFPFSFFFLSMYRLSPSLLLTHLLVLITGVRERRLSLSSIVVLVSAAAVL